MDTQQQAWVLSCRILSIHVPNNNYSEYQPFTMCAHLPGSFHVLVIKFQRVVTWYYTELHNEYHFLFSGKTLASSPGHSQLFNVARE